MARAKATANARKQAMADTDGQHFLPESWRLFLQARGTEALGLVLFAVAFLLALALISHGADDPSLNHAGTESAKNILGFWGAALSDVLIQTIGLASIVLVLVPVGWGWRITSHQGLPYLWANAVAAPIALCLVALTLSALPQPDAWPYRAGLGGVLGDGLFDLVQGVIGLVGLSLPKFAVAAMAGFVGVFVLLLGLGISRAEWLYLIRWFLFATRFVLYWAERGLTAVLERIAHARANRKEAKRRVGTDAVPLKREAAKLKRKADVEVEEGAAPAPIPHKVEPPRVTRKATPKKPSKRAEEDRQPKLSLDDGLGIDMPPLSILTAPPANHMQNRLSDDALEQNARMLEGVLDDFGVKGEITEVRPGPVVTLYELKPAAGIKSSRVIGLADDIARSMSAISARVAVVPGKNAIGIELPNNDRETVYLRELFSSAEFDNKRSKLTLAMGKDIGGAPVMADLASMPHLLIAGTTGSGKSVSINTMILSLLYKLPPDKCRMIMIDPKMIELSVYDDIPHLLSPVVTDPKKAVVALKWAVREMEDRYRKMMKLGVRNITGYNQKIAEAEAKGEPITREVQTGYDDDGKPVVDQEALPLTSLPYIVVVVDEMADLMMVAGKDVEASIQRLAQKARAAGIHLIMATQRPSVDVITGTIKANFPTRVSFQVTSKIDSRTILGEQGAEQLLGMGDMLYMAGGGRITRVHGPFVSDDEVEEVVNHLKSQGSPDYLESVTDESEEELTAMIPGFGGGDDGGSGDSLFDQAVAIVARDRKASTSYLQRKLQIGYNRAANLIEQMEDEGMISAPNHVGKREVLLPEHND